MTGDWMIPLSGRTASAGERGPATRGWTASGRAELTGAALHAPREVDFTYSRGRFTAEDRWRLAIDGDLIWVQNSPDAASSVNSTSAVAQLGDGGLGRQPAPEVVCLRSLEATALGWLDVPAPTTATGSIDHDGRPASVFESTSPRSCRFVVDDETGFVLSVTASGRRGDLSVVVHDFVVRWFELAESADDPS